MKKRYESPLGTITMVSDGENLIGLYFEDTESDDESTIFDQTQNWLDAYFYGRELEELPPIRLEGTEFQQEVWNLLLEIPFGETISYSEIAKMIAWKRGKKCMSAQAVGGAVGRNPISILVPCHRVIGSDGSLTGYRGGLWRKEALLKLESISGVVKHRR